MEEELLTQYRTRKVRTQEGLVAGEEPLAEAEITRRARAKQEDRKRNLAIQNRVRREELDLRKCFVARLLLLYNK